MNQLNKVLNGITNENPCKAIQNWKFSSRWWRLISPTSSEEEGQKLIAAAQALIDQLDCLEVPKNANAVKLSWHCIPVFPIRQLRRPPLPFTVPAQGWSFSRLRCDRLSGLGIGGGEYSAGLHEVEVQVGQWEEGVYFYSLKIPEAVKTERMVIVR
ncbi:MAG: hypothetical protein IPJ40_12070 [Saprospirales bacterium]|nr:hypothetical protein [Saprospirales bacterium]